MINGIKWHCVNVLLKGIRILTGERDYDNRLLEGIRAVTGQRNYVSALLEGIRAVTGQRNYVSALLEGIRAVTGEQERIELFLAAIEELIDQEEKYMLPSFEQGFGRENTSFSYQNEHIKFGINEGDKVLDIGSGGAPFPYATHLADLYEDQTSHRAGPIAKDGRPFVNCNVESLPYEDKEFDFVYCCHVLEHVDNPGRACDEIMRVGKRGYIETPTRVSDIMYNFTGLPHLHRWHITLLDNTLLFIEWLDSEHRSTGCQEFFKMFHSKYKNPFQTLVHNNRHFFINMFEWSGQFAYYVFDKRGELIDRNPESVGRQR